MGLHGHFQVLTPIHMIHLRPRGGAKASAPEWESGGQRGRKKHGALFGRQSHGVAEGQDGLAQVGRGKTIPGEESFICGLFARILLREKREKRDGKTRDREERERERERERDEREMRKR